VDPVEFEVETGGKIEPFWKLSMGVQTNIAEALYAEWRTAFVSVGLASAEDVRLHFISAHDAGEGDLYALTQGGTKDERDGGWVGCVGVSRVSQLPGLTAPCVHHLFVRPDHRGSGLGHGLLKWAEECLRRIVGDTIIGLWCAPGLMGFYAQKGWTRMAMSHTASLSADPMLIMAKRLGATEVHARKSDPRNFRPEIIKASDI
jgi:GNAT superfamily N-acetyltransferase